MILQCDYDIDYCDIALYKTKISTKIKLLLTVEQMFAIIGVENDEYSSSI